MIVKILPVLAGAPRHFFILTGIPQSYLPSGGIPVISVPVQDFGLKSLSALSQWRTQDSILGYKFNIASKKNAVMHNMHD